jgi:hypothetical protein
MEVYTKACISFPKYTFPSTAHACGNRSYNDVQAYRTIAVSHFVFATILVNLQIVQKLNTLLMLFLYT